MFLTNIQIKNFRPIGEEGLKLSISTNLTTILGENNVGKSSIFKAINKILEFPQTQWISEEWHAGNRKKILEIKFSCELDDSTIKKFIELMQLSITINQYKSVFSNKITYYYAQDENNFKKIITLGVFHINRNQGWLGEIGNSETAYSRESFSEAFKHIFANPEPINYIKEYLNTQARNKPNKSVEIIIPRSDWIDFFLQIIRKKFVIIEDYREKPHKTLSNFFVSPTGKDLSSMLFNLKNGKDTEEKFERIQKNFEHLFPQLKLNVFRDTETNEIELLFTKEHIKSTTSYVGAGILEALLLLTHLEAYKDHIFLIDHPETHLHPHAQRRLNSIIEKSDDNQILIITHSPYFVNFNKKSRVVRVSQKNHKTMMTCSPEEFFSEKELFKVDQFLDSTTKELFFARKVILVEGPTEIGALPIFANALNFNLDDFGISLINVDGKDNFPIFSKICEAFKIPYVMLADCDAQQIMEKIKKRFKDSESIILPKDFDELLPLDLRNCAKSKCGNSKPRNGRYVAQQMLEKVILIPDVIQHLFSRIQKM